MRVNGIARAIVVRVLCALAMSVAALWVATAAAAFAPDATETATPEPTATGEASATIAATTEPTSDPGTVTPTATIDRGGLAPGFVTVVVWTSDGGPLSDRATVCVGALCQSAQGLPNGTKIVFDRVEHGWHDVTVRGGAPYGEASAPVNVVQGQGSRIELTVVLTRPAPEEPPTERASGPLRDPIVVAPGDGELTWETATEGAVVASVNALPVTGAGERQDGAHGMLLALGATALVVAGLAAVRRGTARA